MCPINAILTLNLVGPQASADKTGFWRFCLRLSAGYGDEPATFADRKSWAKALLPWLLFQGKGLTVFVVDPSGAAPAEYTPFDLDVDPPDHFPDDPIGHGLPPIPGFTSALRNDVITGLAKLVQANENLKTRCLSYKWNPMGSPDPNNPGKRLPTVVSGSTNNKNGSLSLPGLLKTLAALPPDLSQSLRAAWYFRVPYDKLSGYLKPDLQLQMLVAPQSLTDTRIPTPLTYPLVRTNPLIKVTDSIFKFTYGSAGVISASTTGFAIPLSGMDSSKNYWLPITDVRGATVSDIDQKIAQCVDPINRVTYVSAEQLADTLNITPSKPPASNPNQVLVIPSNLVIAQYLLSNAPVGSQDWKRPDPADAAGNQKRLKAVQDILANLKTPDAGTPPLAPEKRIKRWVTDDVSGWWTFDWMPSSTPNSGQWLQDLLTSALANGSIENLDNIAEIQIKDASNLAAALISRIFPDDPSGLSSATLPNEGFDLLLGDPTDALVHEDSDPTNTGDESQMAAAGMLVRSATKPEDLPNRPWRLVTAGIPMVDTLNQYAEIPFGYNTLNKKPEAPNTGEPLAGGLTMDFINSVRRSELTYQGENLRIQSPLAFVHRQKGQNSSPPDVNPQFDVNTQISTLSFQPPGSLGGKLADGTDRPNVTSTLSPPLRYGDIYEFAAFMIDRVFGMPDELVDSSGSLNGKDNFNPGFNWSMLAGQLPKDVPTKVLTCLRRVPVGEINVLPSSPRWPVPPPNVSLRAPEWLKAVIQQDAQVVAGLDSGRIHAHSTPMLFLLPADGRFVQVPQTSSSYQFTIEPPRMDEFTFSRWSMPALVGGSRGDCSGLKTKLKDIFRQRDALMASGEHLKEPYLPHEQSFSAYGIRCHFVHDTGQETLRIATVRTTPNPKSPFDFNPLAFTVKFAASVPSDLSQLMVVTPASVTIAVPEGWFCGIELVPLVTLADYKDRFDGLAMTGLVETDPWIDDQDNQFCAFESTWVLTESVTDCLPDAKALYDNLSLSFDSPTGDIRVTLKTPPTSKDLLGLIANLAFVDTLTLSRQRWFWRNRPLLDPSLTPPNPIDDEWRRLAAGGLPADLFNGSPSPDISSDVLRFDVMAGMDSGLLDRASLVVRLPHQPGGAPLVGNILLAVDDRDAVTAADYLRYGMTVKSRYASLIADSSKQQIIAASGVPNNYETNPVWRRIAVPYRGDLTQIKPLKIFTILPLTRLPQESPFGTMELDGPTPFLVVLDEMWFREYGQGERLEAYLAIEDSDTIAPPDLRSTLHAKDATGDQRPFQVAPLPDRHVQPASSTGKTPFYMDKTDVADTHPNDDPVPFGVPVFPLDVFGPFGYTLDQSDNQSLANATAYIVYPPAGVGVNWWMGVRLRRRLDKVFDPKTAQCSATICSLPSDVRHFYTRSANLVGLGQAAKLILHQPSGEVKPVNLELQLSPISPFDPAIAKQYACVLILGNMIADGGLGQQIFVPSSGCWLNPNGEGIGVALNWQQFKDTPLPKTFAGFGRIMLLLLNGHYDNVPNPLAANTASLADLWRQLLPLAPPGSGSASDTTGDSPAMVTGISDQFAVQIIEDVSADLTEATDVSLAEDETC